MSTQTSPQVSHLPPSYQTTPLSTTSSANLQGHPNFPPSAQSSYSDGRTDGSNEENATPSKQKNGSGDGKIKPHICVQCHRGFTTGGHLQRHMRIHTGVKAFKCPYPGCETKTSRQDNLQQHYRTHLSPSLRRGSGSAARAAVNAAMEAAGLKSAARAPRKSKGSGAGTPSSASTSHVPSPYATPTTQGPTSYAPYMYDPQHSYPNYPVPSNLNMPQTASANSSRVPSPVNGHAAMTATHHPQQYFPQPFPPMYYPGMHPQYRYNGAMPPYPSGPMYSPGMTPEHGQPHMYSGPMQPARDGYIMNPGYAMNGYPPRNQNSAPINQNHGDDYRNHRPPSPRRRTPPQDLVGQGVVDPSTMGRPQPLQPPYGGYQQPLPYPYNTPQSAPPGARMDIHRASISSASDASVNDGSDGSGKGMRH